MTVCKCLAIGYVSALSRIDPAPLRDIDVLFYGSFNECREQVVLALLADEPALQRYRDAGLQLMRNLPLAPALANALHSLAEREPAAPLSMAALFGAPGQVPGRGS